MFVEEHSEMTRKQILDKSLLILRKKGIALKKRLNEETLKRWIGEEFNVRRGARPLPPKENKSSSEG